MSIKLSSISLPILSILSCLCFTNISHAAPYFQDSFEGGNKTHTENGAGWLSSGSNVTVSTDTARTGSYSLKLAYPATTSGTDSSAEQRFTLGSAKNDVYIRYYIKFPSNYFIRADNPSNNKMIELWGEESNYSTDTQLTGSEAWNTASGVAELGPTAYMNSSKQLSYLSGSVYNHIWWSGVLNSWILTSNDLNKWLCFEWHFKKDTGAGDGALEFFVDGVKKWGSTSLHFAGAPTSSYFKTGYLLGWSNSGFAQNTTIYIDDVKMSDTYIGPDNAGATLKAPTNLLVI